MADPGRFGKALDIVADSGIGLCLDAPRHRPFRDPGSGGGYR